MEKIVTITPQESEHVHELFAKYNSYLNILGYFADRGSTEENSLYDKKWNEAVMIGIELENAKRDVERKYKPEGDWASFEFDFYHNQVVFKTK